MNPVLREGNSDRRAPEGGEGIRAQAPARMGKWDAASKSHVAHMEDGDFYASEQSYDGQPDNLRIEFTSATGSSSSCAGRCRCRRAR